MFKLQQTRHVSPALHLQLAGRKLKRRTTMQASESSALVQSDMLNLAQAMANEASKVTKPLFRAKVATDIKADQTLVTEADKAAEQRMREMVNEQFPSHAVFGEEEGFEPGKGVYQSAAR